MSLLRFFRRKKARLRLLHVCRQAVQLFIRITGGIPGICGCVFRLFRAEGLGRFIDNVEVCCQVDHVTAAAAVLAVILPEQGKRKRAYPLQRLNISGYALLFFSSLCSVCFPLYAVCYSQLSRLYAWRRLLFVASLQLYCDMYSPLYCRRRTPPLFPEELLSSLR